MPGYGGASGKLAELRKTDCASKLPEQVQTLVKMSTIDYFVG